MLSSLLMFYLIIEIIYLVIYGENRKIYFGIRQSYPYFLDILHIIKIEGEKKV